MCVGWGDDGILGGQGWATGVETHSNGGQEGT